MFIFNTPLLPKAVGKRNLKRMKEEKNEGKKEKRYSSAFPLKRK